LRAAWLAVWFWPTIQMVRGVGSFVVLAYGGYLIIRGSITLGIFIAFLSYLDQFYRPIISLTWLYDSIQRAMAASERIDELMREAPEVKDREEAIELKKIRGEVVFEDVYFEYQKGIPVLKGINLKIRPGERIGIVGPTGSGKTTLVLLLCRLYDVSRGRILIDGHDIRDIKQKSLRSQIGFIPQDTFLFPGTIMDNIRLGRPDASDDEIVQVCKELGIHEFIESLPNGYQTEVGEKGFLLSAGQRQLIAVARAMLRRPSILILDEALSNVDPRTELLLRRAIERIMKGRTTIVIAHRLWLCSLCDRVVVIDKGRIVEEGTHEELLRRKGLYYELYLAQMEKLIDEKLLRIRPIRPS
ncbi:MAG: ABC transporter ATP-binding protein, partial [Thermoprotei archaeon]